MMPRFSEMAQGELESGDTQWHLLTIHREIARLCILGVVTIVIIVFGVDIVP